MKFKKNQIFYIFLLFGAFFSFVNFAHADTGTIDTSNDDNQAKVCHNVACDDFGIINFELTNDTMVIDSDNGITGQVWGNELGWITMNPTGAGVVFADPDTGELTGKAWSQVSGWINFAPTGEGVTIDPDTGEFEGYAWSGGAYGGWIKFDCNDASTCVQTTWRGDSGPCEGGCTTPTDVCSNIPGKQTSVPDGYEASGGECYGVIVDTFDLCSNIPGYQVEIPSGMHWEGFLQCVNDTDVCSNLPGAQMSVPSGMHIEGGQCINNDDGGGGGDDGDDGCVGASCDGTDEDPPCVGAACNDIDDGCVGAGCGDTDGGCVGAGCGDSDDDGGGGVIPDIIDDIGTGVVEIVDDVGYLLEGVDAKVVSKVLTLAGLISSGLALLLGVLLSNPFGIADLGLNLMRLWSMFLYGMGFKKRNRPWGVVYDSVTKQPLDPAYVVLKNIQGEEIATSITDIDGRYGFLVDPGIYTIATHKTNYSYPSSKLAGKTSDELYNDLYFGEQIEIKSEGEVIVKNIPMDRIGFDWNEFAKKEQRRMKFFHHWDVIFGKFSDIMFILGFLVSVIVLIVVPGPYNVIIFGLYVLMFGLRRLSIGRGKKGNISFAESGVPISYGILRVFSQSGQEIAHRVVDRLGNYYCLVPNGYYITTIEQKNEDSTYSKVFTSEPLEVKGGILKKDFKI